MDTSKATVTIPYSEFSKHQDQVKEIEWARDIKKKMDSGELFSKDSYMELAEKLFVMGQLIEAHQSTSFGTKIDSYSFLERLGYKAKSAEAPGANGSKVKILLIEKNK